MKAALARKWNPYSPLANSLTTTITLGTETNDVRNVAVVLKDAKRRATGAGQRIRFRLTSDSAGLVNLTLPPTDGVYAGTNGALIQGQDHLRDGLIAKGTLVIDAVPEKFKTTTTLTARIKGVTFTKVAATAIVFSAAHPVTASKFGVILIQVNAAGTVSTKIPGATQTTAQAYATAPLALAALPQPDVDKTAIGYIAIAAKAALWTANTDDLTNGSDLTTATFNDAPEQIGPVTFEAISAASGLFDFNVKETGVKSMYVALDMPDGSMKVSSVMAFA